jgi:hypothetical protein
VARAFRLALEVENPGFGPYFISGATTLAPEPTLERLAKRTRRPVDVRRPGVYAANPHAPLYDLEPARKHLGFTPQHDLRAKLVDNQ